MLSTSSPDFSFFSPSKGSSRSVVSSSKGPSRSVVSSSKGPSRSVVSSPPVVTKRIAHVPAPPPSWFPHIKRKSSPIPAPDLPREVKRLRAAPKRVPRKSPSVPASRSSSRASSATDSRPPSPEPIYRGSRSRSASAFPGWDDQCPIQSRHWKATEDGEPGENHWSSEQIVKRLMKSYKPYFRNHDDPRDYSFKPHPTRYPVVELEYPNTGAVEQFILLAPKDKDHYNPIMDLEKSLYTIIECYLTPAQQALFGSIPSETLSEALSPLPSLSSSPPNSPSSDSISSSTYSLSGLSSVSSPGAKPVPLLRALQRAIHRQDGPLFRTTMDKINTLLRTLKYPPVPNDPFASPPCNSLKYSVTQWTQTGMPKKVLMRIIEENYQRSVGPYVQSLKAYEAFSSTVYGELMPSLAYEMIQISRLREDSLFLDLGSGVGNVCAQASLQTGCRSYGIEVLPGPAKIAREMKEHLAVRCRMWGVRLGEIELEEGDMLKSSRVNELIPQADVVLVDNKVFDEKLNEALRPKFLDLKEGAIVISLKPFVSSLNARVTERNVDDISAIFDVVERPYHSGSVSWGNSGGSYYVHRVDRAGYAEILARFENSRVGTGRSSRMRRS
ncbi:Histone-lysine N-methyltransferase, H3 lysine-79 specific [Termitomyces sp. T112]|nr:hypothetical protein C0989_004982 [Termitomyces sp. Mn162]KAG5730294.1 Histone-lysine N-methyltransferase, H3 lysine-79 specific [Termitomyces sp. T112]